MQDLDDNALLREYVERDSHDAFAALVTRHVNKVYSVAWRYTRNAHQAEEVTQVVFAVLARKSRHLGKSVVLSGWLYKTARLTASNLVRGEVRRARREQEALNQASPSETESEIWPQILPLLDAAMAGLNEADHDAVVLRFFDGKSMKEVGAALGASEDAVKVRVNRAVNRLRKFFERRGIRAAAGGIVAAISSGAAQGAPAGLAAKISGAVLSGNAIVSSSTLAAATKTIAMTTLQKTIVATTVVLLAGVGCWQAVQTSRLRAENQTLRQRQAPIEEQIQQLRSERDGTANRLAALADDMERLNGDKTELLKLRNEVGQLRRQAALEKAKAGTPGTAVAKLMNDSSNIELTRLKTRQAAEIRYSPLANQLNLSPESTDKLLNLIKENQLNKRAIYAQLISGDLDVDAALQSRAAAKADMQKQIEQLLGESGYAQYNQFNHETDAAAVVKALNGELGGLALNDEQSRRVQEIIAARPDIDVDDMDLFRSKETLDELFQSLANRSDRDLEKAAGFLTPEQMTAINNINSNSLKTLRAQMTLGQELAKKAQKK